MGRTSGEDSNKSHSNDHCSNAHEEKIFVAIRLRPLNEKEHLKNDVSDWECFNDNTVLFKNHSGERSLLPTAYQYDRVFGCDCSTRKVYEEAAKRVALEVLNGINSSVFAYGQTSSGKTYTMSGITEFALADIFEYVNKHRERQFTLKFSALEIYNESVRDLLSTDSTPLRLLDDPEKGTVVDKLTEVKVRGWRHVKELLSVCEAQRRIGETSMNEMSSRSHQILRLTVESRATQYSRSKNNSNLSASVDFVDLAGSEKASQTLSVNTRLKEGSHINKSLLALGTCIRKLSKGRNGHIPYRDSKLTRILQNSLGGNARTAIICTLSPAHSQAEQSRNTLMFATCAKQVSTNAHVNAVMTEKVLVKQLQSEVERLETELRNLAAFTAPAMKEKEAIIEKMDKEIRDLMRQRDTAQSWIHDLLHSRSWAEMTESSETPDYHSASEASDLVASHFSDTFDSFDEPPDDLFLSDDTSPSIYFDKYFGPDPCKGWENTGHQSHHSLEDVWKEVQCVETDSNTVFIDSYEAPPIEEGNHTSMESIPLFPRAEPEKVNVGATNQPLKVKAEAANQSQKFNVEATHQSRKVNAEATHQSRKVNVEATHQSQKVNVEVTPQSQKVSNVEATHRSQKVHVEATHQSQKGNLKATNQPQNVNVVSTNQPQKGNVEAKNQSQKVNVVSTNQPQNVRVEATNRPQKVNVVSTNQPQNVNVEATNQSKKVNVESTNQSQKVNVESTNQSQKVNVESTNHTQKGNVEATHQSQKVNVEAKNESQKLIVEATNESQMYCDRKREEQDQRIQLMGDNTGSGAGFATKLTKDAKDKPEKKHSDDAEEGKVKSEKQLYQLLYEAEEIHKEFVKFCGDSLALSTSSQQTPSNGSMEFEKKMKEIIELWDECYVPLVHRTYFFLLFKGDPSDLVYMEVELRRLYFLKNKWSQGVEVVNDGQVLTKPASIKALKQERKMLSRQLRKKLGRKEREALFQRWGVDVKTYHRRRQLSELLWKDTKDMEHIQESADLVAKLVGLIEPSEAPKEMFGLSFALRPKKPRKTFMGYG